MKSKIVEWVELKRVEQLEIAMLFNH